VQEAKLTVRIPAQTLNELHIAARRQGKTLTQVVRALVEEYLREQEEGNGKEHDHRL
jgi:predicted DNA-binding protein